MFEWCQANFGMDIGSVEQDVFALRYFSAINSRSIAVEFLVLFVFLGDTRKKMGVKLNCYVEKDIRGAVK